MSRNARVALISVSVLFALLAINLYIFSPWHTHGGSISNRPCNFSSLEHGNGVQAFSVVIVAPPAMTVWLPAGPDPALRTHDLRVPCAGRAPPA